jgi:putative flippase GtrA
MPKLIDRLPARVASRLRTRFGTQFVRFALVAVVSLGASEIALALFIGPLHMTGGVSGFSAAIVGAVVSYFLSRRAWNRKGRPNVLRETIPFWLVSVGAWLVLGLATKLGYYVAHSLDLHHLKRHLVIGGIYFVANCFTFLIRFLIFHYVLFADRGEKDGAGYDQAPAGLIEAESLSPVTVPASSQDAEDQRR